MQNYLMLNGKKIELTNEQVKTLLGGSDKEQVRLSDIPVGKTFKINEYEFIVLERSSGATAVLLKNLLHNSEKFGSNNNYDGSNADKLCCEFGDKIAEIVGADNLIEHTVDLTADDGLKCYGSVKRKMSLLTAQQYREYVYIIDEHKLDKWWWLATAYSTAKHDDADWVKCVSPDGGISSITYYDGSYGVRPFCILKSNIFVSL